MMRPLLVSFNGILLSPVSTPVNASRAKNSSGSPVVKIIKRTVQAILVTIACTMLSLFLPRSVPASTGDEAIATGRDLTDLSVEELMQIEVATVYSASKFEQKVTEAPSSVSIVTADEISKYGYRTLVDLLRSQRSFHITYDRDYHYAGVRGFGRSGDYNSRILLLVDGHRINDNLYDSAPIGTEFPVDLDLIDRVEIIRGPGSSLYGNNAFFAVINIITRTGQDLATVEASGEAGSFDTWKGRLTFAKSFKNGLEALVSGTYYDSGGDRLFFREFNSPENNNGITGHTDYDRSHSALARLAYGDVTLEGAYSSRTKGVPTSSFGKIFNDPRNRDIDTWWFADLKYAHSLWNRVDVTGRLFYDAYNYDGTGVFAETGVNIDRGRGRWWGGELQAATLLGRHRIVIGTEYRDNLRQDQVNFDEDPFQSHINDKRKSSTWAGYIQDQLTLHNKLILNAGIRYDYYSTFGSTVNPRLALIYTPFDGTVFKILYGSAFRAPNVYELYFDSPSLAQKGNPGLGPEKIKTYEVICEQYLGKRLRGTVTGFYYTIDNLIMQVTDPADDLAVYRNLDNAEVKGVEFELEGKWDNGLTGRASYSFQDARDSNTDLALVNAPRHLAKINIIVPLLRKKLFLGIEEQFTGRRKTLAADYNKAFFITNLTLFSRNLLKNLELSATLYNLFDNRYSDPGGTEHIQDIIQQDGRTFRVKLTYRF
jgi:outer membrane receptor for ferrienterochelin and colicins